MGDVLAAIVSFASKVKDDPAVSDLLREAAADLHAEITKLIGAQVPEGQPAPEAPPAEPAPPPAEG